MIWMFWTSLGAFNVSEYAVGDFDVLDAFDALYDLGDLEAFDDVDALDDFDDLG